MELIRGWHNLRAHHHGCVATIGNFDGVHRGHRAVLARLQQEAQRDGLPSTVIIFEPQPLEYFRPEAAPPRLTELRSKLQALAEAGVEQVLCLQFGHKLAQMPAEVFVDELLVDRLGVRFLMVGDDFRFGHARCGDYAMLQAAGARHGFTVARMPTVLEGGQRVSSTRVRQALAEGDLALAAQLLGRRYSICGRVVRGQALGRKLGYPTANIAFHRPPPPLDGIFVIGVRLDGVGQSRPGVASLGTRPTVNGTRTLLEVHLFDYSGDLYGRQLEVEFLQRLRGEERFDSLDALRVQMDQDAAAARAYFSARS
ncbi:MAG TPA: bifunctional riboflavin kinase/FAD synthetase [Gammaproteobacteria bacterium]|nr:bifunctional riboflavin kinase/FAD synthetase [Gammaproteobacteria bacterium]